MLRLVLGFVLVSVVGSPAFAQVLSPESQAVPATPGTPDASPMAVPPVGPEAAPPVGPEAAPPVGPEAVVAPAPPELPPPLPFSGAPLSLETHAFVSQGFIFSTGNNYLAESKRGSFEFTEVGINFTSQLTERLRLGMQLFARDLGPVGDYNAHMDWLYLDYRWRDWFGLRFGRVKLPFGLYNDTSDIDAVRVPVLLPQAVYPLTSRDFLLAQTGGEIYGYLNMGGAGALDYRLYGGTIFAQLPNQPGSPFTGLRSPYIVGGRVLWELPLEGWRLGGSVQALRLDIDALVPATEMMPPTPVTLQANAVLWLASLEYAANDLLFAAEYGRWHVDASSSNQMLFPIQGKTSVVSERGYAMAAYRVNLWLQPGVYYALLFPDVDFRTRGRADVQHDVAATVRFDINAHWLVKLEGHYMNGTAGLQTALNNNTQAAMLTENWVVFLVKTTAHF